MKANTDPRKQPVKAAPSVTIHPLKENQRPIGYLPWPEPEKPKRTRKPKDAA